MKKIRDLLFRRVKPAAKREPLEMHKLPWHPLFYKTLSVHIQNTTRSHRW